MGDPCPCGDCGHGPCLRGDEAELDYMIEQGEARGAGLRPPIQRRVVQSFLHNGHVRP